MGYRVSVESRTGYRVEANNGARATLLDMPADEGGEGAGLSPTETLLSALGGCTAMTLRIYAQRKGWPLEGVSADLVREKPAPGAADARDRIVVDVRLRGPLDDAQRAKLMEIAQKCPVYRLLTGDLEVVERLVP